MLIFGDLLALNKVSIGSRMSLFWGIVLAGIGAYTMRASFVLLLSGVSFPDRVIRILDHVGPAVMAIASRMRTNPARLRVESQQLNAKNADPASIITMETSLLPSYNGMNAA